MTFEKSGKSS